MTAILGRKIETASAKELGIIVAGARKIRNVCGDAVEQVMTLPLGVKSVPNNVKARALRLALDQNILGALGEYVAYDRNHGRPEDGVGEPGEGVFRLLAIPGFSNVLAVNSPEIAHQIFANGESAFGRDPAMLEFLVGSSALSEDPTTEAWKEKRAAIDAHMGSRLQEIHQKAMKSEIYDAVDTLEDGTLVDTFKLSQRISFGVMARLLIGENPSGEMRKQKDILDKAAMVLKNEAIQLILNPMARSKLLRDNVFPVLYKEFTDAMNQLRTATSTLVAIERENIAAGKPSNTFLTSLLAPIQHRGQTITLSEEDILGEFITLILAGSVTTANTMGWLSHVSARDPKVQGKMREEIDRFLLDKGTALENLNTLTPPQLPYTYAAVSETLRIYPPAAAAIRTVKKDTTIDGVRFSKGDMVLVDIYHPQVDPEIFPDPLMFKPERFARGMAGLTLKQRNAYNPFGGGVTICPGRNFALQEILWLQVILRQRGFQFESWGCPAPVSSGDVTNEPQKEVGFEHRLYCRKVA